LRQAPSRARILSALRPKGKPMKGLSFLSKLTIETAWSLDAPDALSKGSPKERLAKL
jgi:hypothetical protein